MVIAVNLKLVINLQIIFKDRLPRNKKFSNQELKKQGKMGN